MSPADKRRPPYPLCPLCGCKVVGAMMTSSSIEVDGVRYYAPKAVSVYCCSGDCNYSRELAELPYPPSTREPMKLPLPVCSNCDSPADLHGPLGECP